MGWQQQVITAPVVIIQSGVAGAGLFVYSGAPAQGNPPQFAVVAPGVTLDPFGNAVTSSKILVQGSVITETSGIFRTAATAPLIQLDGPHDALFVYDAAANLVAAISPAAGNDGLGHSFVAGIQAIAGTASSILAGGVIQISATPLQSVAAQFSVSGSIGVSTQLNIASGVGTEAGATGSTLILGDSGVGIGLQVIDGKDGQTYKTERIRQSTTSTQTFTLASFVAITGLSRTLGKGTYHAHVKVFYVPSGVIGSTHSLALNFTGTATANLNGQCWQQQAANAVQVNSLNGGTLASLLGSPTHVAFPGWMDLEADITVTATGTLTPQITLGTAGDNIITSAGTFWEINPES